MHKRRRGETVSKAHSAACAERRSEGFVNLDINHTFQWEIIVDRKHCETALHHCSPAAKKLRRRHTASHVIIVTCRTLHCQALDSVRRVLGMRGGGASNCVFDDALSNADVDSYAGPWHWLAPGLCAALLLFFSLLTLCRCLRLHSGIGTGRLPFAG